MICYNIIGRRQGWVAGAGAKSWRGGRFPPQLVAEKAPYNNEYDYLHVLHIYIYTHIHIYIYIYIERERDVYIERYI